MSGVDSGSEEKLELDLRQDCKKRRGEEEWIDWNE